MLLQLLLQQTNPSFNQSFYESVISDSLRKSIESIIIEQRETIDKLHKQLTYQEQIMGTVRLSRFGNSALQTTHRLEYFNHKVDADNNTVYITHTYKPHHLFKQIRDYIEEQLPVLSTNKSYQVYRIFPITDPDYVKLFVSNITLFREIVESIIQGTAEYDDTDEARSADYIADITPISQYDRICAFDFNFIPYQFVSNYYLRLFGYEPNKNSKTYISLVSIKKKQIALTIDGMNTSPETINYNIKRFIDELKNWRQFDPKYEGYIIVEGSSDYSTRLYTRVKKEFEKLKHLAYDNPNNEVDINGLPILTKIPITLIDH